MMKFDAELYNTQPQSWLDIAHGWQADEEKPGSKSVFMLDQGQDWQAWRNKIILPLHLDKLVWSQSTVIDTAKTIPRFRGGPFESWQQLYYGGKKCPTFAEIVANPKTDVQHRDKFAEILANAVLVNLVGIVKDDEVYIVEGMHRCVAIALAASREQPIACEVRVSLAATDLLELPNI